MINDRERRKEWKIFMLSTGRSPMM
jgi:hypothetical protein